MRRLITAAVLLSIATTTHAASVASSSSSPGLQPLPASMLEYKIAYLRLPKFTADTARRIPVTMQYLNRQKPRGLIIDVRDNQGGEVQTVRGILEALLPKGTPYMRNYSKNVKTLDFTREMPIFKKSMPVVVLRDHRTVNEPDILVYMLQKLRKGGVVEFSPTRDALTRAYKQHVRMDQYRPIKEGVFFVTPDARVIGVEGADQDDVIPRAIIMIREMSPWDEPKAARR